MRIGARPSSVDRRRSNSHKLKETTASFTLAWGRTLRWAPMVGARCQQCQICGFDLFVGHSPKSWTLILLGPFQLRMFCDLCMEGGRGTQGGCGVSLSEHSKPTWAHSCVTAPGDPALAGAWMGSSPEVPSDPNNSVIIRSCVSLLVKLCWCNPRAQLGSPWSEAAKFSEKNELLPPDNEEGFYVWIYTQQLYLISLDLCYTGQTHQ